MKHESAVLARHDGFGSVTRCSHGRVHVRLGVTTMTLTDEEYVRFVAMLNDSAAKYESSPSVQDELERESFGRTPHQPSRRSRNDP